MALPVGGRVGIVGFRFPGTECSGGKSGLPAEDAIKIAEVGEAAAITGGFDLHAAGDEFLDLLDANRQQRVPDGAAGCATVEIEQIIFRHADFAGGALAVKPFGIMFPQEFLEVSYGVLPAAAAEDQRTLPGEFNQQLQQQIAQHFDRIRIDMGAFVVDAADSEIEFPVGIDQVQQIVTDRFLRAEFRAENREEAVTAVKLGQIAFDRTQQKKQIVEFDRPIQGEVGQVVGMVEADEAGAEGIFAAVDFQHPGSGGDIEDLPELPSVQRFGREEGLRPRDVVQHDDRQLVLEIIRRAEEFS